VQQLAVGRIVEPANRAALLKVGLVGDLLGVPDRLVDDVGGVQDLRHLFLGLVRRPLLQGGIDFHLALGLDADVGLGVLGG